MKALIISLGLLVSLAAVADPANPPAPVPAPGAPVEHQLTCASVHHRLGVAFSLVVTTQALAPEYNIRGITLVRRVVAPRAKPQAVPLKQFRQDARSATFYGNGVRVVLDKATFQAEILEGRHVQYLCK